MARSTPNTRASDAKKEIARIRRKYKTNLSSRAKLLPSEVPHVKSMVVILKLAGYSRTQIGKVVGISRFQVREMLDSPDAQEQLVFLRARMPQAALDLIQSLMVEAVVAIADVMRSSEDDQTILKAAADLLDRGGVAKTSRQERQTINEERTTFTDDGIVDRLRESSPEVQEEAAQIMERLEILLAEQANVVAEDDSEQSE